jgi:hypothetical protein
MKVLKTNVSEINNQSLFYNLGIMTKVALEKPMTHVSCMTISGFKKGSGVNVIGSSE